MTGIHATTIATFENRVTGNQLTLFEDPYLGGVVLNLQHALTL